MVRSFCLGNVIYPIKSCWIVNKMKKRLDFVIITWYIDQVR